MTKSLLIHPYTNHSITISIVFYFSDSEYQNTVGCCCILMWGNLIAHISADSQIVSLQQPILKIGVSIAATAFNLILRC